MSTCLQSQNLYEYQLGQGAKKIEIPFEYENNLIVVNVVFNGIFPLRFVFDTGAEHTVLTRKEITDLLLINYQRKFTLYGADLSTKLTAYIAAGISMELGKLKLDNKTILVLDEDYFNYDEFNGVDVHGIIGADIFRRFVVQINYNRRTITLFPFNKFKLPHKSFEEFPVEIHRGKPYVWAPISSPSDSIINAKLLMDTGSGIPLILYPKTLETISIPENVIPAKLGLGLGGYLEGVIGRVKAVEVGKLEFRNIVTSFQNLAPGTDSIYINFRNGIIGNQSLKHFHIIIDYVNYRLYLRPVNRRRPPKFKYDRSGLFLVAGGRNINQFKVASVVPGSPADKAGLKEGDDIKKINGLPCATMSLSTLNRKFTKRVGKRFKIVFRRNGVRKKAQFTLRDII